MMTLLLDFVDRFDDGMEDQLPGVLSAGRFRHLPFIAHALGDEALERLAAAHFPYVLNPGGFLAALRPLARSLLAIEDDGVLYPGDHVGGAAEHDQRACQLGVGNLRVLEQHVDR